MHELATLLKAKGHHCVLFDHDGKPNATLKWCQRDVCLDKGSWDALYRRHQERENHAAEFRRTGQAPTEYPD